MFTTYNFTHMLQFMVTFELPVPFTEEFIQKIPEQRDVINELVSENRINSFALSTQRDRFWCVVNAKSEFEVLEIIHQFPLIDSMPYEISELLFHQTATIKIPAFSLN